MTFISVIIGSTREGRFSEKPAKWFLQHLKKRKGVDARLLDLRDFPMPFFDEVASNAWAPSQNPVAQRWQKKVAELYENLQMRSTRSVSRQIQTIRLPPSQNRESIVPAFVVSRTGTSTVLD
jgi:FMN-dependent NADH-azoreductase